ncbi:MAG: hypothetical protein ACE5QW_04385 [Thermoplasmata archaeon]
MQYKSIRITEDAYNQLVALKEQYAAQAKKKSDLETLGMLAAMGLGAFAGWVIFKMASDIAEKSKDA